MKNILKFGVLALAFGLFVTACQSGTNNAAGDESGTTVDSMSTMPPAPAPDTATLPVDTTAAGADSAATN